jgi:hypothetical protein
MINRPSLSPDGVPRDQRLFLASKQAGNRVYELGS